MKFTSYQWKGIVILYISITILLIMLLSIKIGRVQNDLTNHLTRIEQLMITTKN